MSMNYGGTGVTQGPYSLSQGTLLTLNDPADYSVPSSAIQLQNNSGFTLTVQSAGATYNIMPFFAQTIPTLDGGQSITVNPANPIQSAGNQTGALTVVWMLPGQDAPIQDGALTPIIINSREQSPSFTSVSGSQYTYYYPLQATDQSQEYIFFPSSGHGYTISYTVTGLTSGHVYASGAGFAVASVGSTALGPFQAFGSIDSQVALVVTSATYAPVVEIVLFTSALNNAIITSDSAPLFVTGGPGLSLDVVPIGGASLATVSTTVTTTTQILGAPVSGYSYKLHSISMYYQGTASTTPVLGRLENAAGTTLAVLAYPYQNTIYLGGLLIAGAVYVQSSSTTTTGYSLTYDTIQTPTIQ
jgi:hypothetical protein